MSLTKLLRFLLPLLLLTVGIAANAQSVLPLPTTETVVRGVPAPSGLYPVDTFRPWQVFQWNNAEAPKYVIKFTVVETGELFKLVLKGDLVNCHMAQCYAPTSWFEKDVKETLHDGQHIKWRVIAKYAGGSKVKGENLTVTVDEVNPATLTTPVDGVLMMAVGSLNWNNDNFTEIFSLRIRDAQTKTQVFSMNLNGESGCAATCTVSAAAFWSSLQLGGVTYEWYVVSTGVSGE
jgi:hypothetical protein